MKAWTPARRRALIAALRGRPLLRIVAMAAVSAVALAIVTTLSIFQQHPFAILYASALFAVWVAQPREALVAITLSAVLSAILLPFFPALPLEELIYLGASGLMLTLIRRLRAVRARAEAAVRQRDALFATVSHDLKNPLLTIKGQATLLQRRIAATPPEDARLTAGLASIDAAATRMARLLNELLDVAQIQDTGALVLEKQRADLVALARRLASEYQYATNRHDIRVEAPLAEVVGFYDTFRLERVLDNLLSNAVKYSPGGGAITVTVDRASDGQALLRVRDHGVGIPAGDLPHIFEGYRRAGNVGRIAGTGLGLAGARAIVTQHGGAITIDSVVGQGTTVTVTLPAL